MVVLNTSLDLTELVAETLKDEGYRVAWTTLNEVRHGTVDLESFLREHRPDVIIYDIGPPYDQMWGLFERLRGGVLKPYPLVLSTGNLKALKEIVGVDDLLEVNGQEADLSALIGRVKQALSAPSR